MNGSNQRRGCIERLAPRLPGTIHLFTQEEYVTYMVMLCSLMSEYVPVHQPQSEFVFGLISFLSFCMPILRSHLEYTTIRCLDPTR